MKVKNEQILYCDKNRKTSIITYEDGFKALFKIGNYDVEALERIRQNKPPHIVKILKCNENVMLTEHIDGMNFYAYNPIKIHAYDAMLQLCDGVAELHSLGVVHLDIYPANVMIRETGEVLITDLETAKCLKNGVVDRKYYLKYGSFYSPEIKYGGIADHRSDIYALGATLEYISRCDYIRFPIAHIIEKCKRSDPAKRYNSALEVKNDLLKVIGHLVLVKLHDLSYIL